MTRSQKMQCALQDKYIGVVMPSRREREASTFLSRHSLLNRAWQATSFIPFELIAFISYSP